MKAAGFGLFVIGIVIAITAGAKLPGTNGDAAAQFPDTLIPFAGGVVVCVAGLVLWWKEVLRERASARATAGRGVDGEEESNAVMLLERLQESLRSMTAEVDNASAGEITDRIDALIDRFVTPLSEARHDVVDRFGMAHGSQILVATAYGERMLNRVYSAAADGDLSEARSSFHEAAAAFDEASAMFDQNSSFPQ